VYVQILKPCISSRGQFHCCCFLLFIFSGHFNSRIIISSQSFRLFSKKLRWFSFFTSCPRTGPSFPVESCREGIGAAAVRPRQPVAGSPASGWWPTEKTTKTMNLCRNWPLRWNCDFPNLILIRTSRKDLRPASLAPWPALGNCKERVHQMLTHGCQLRGQGGRRSRVVRRS